MTYFEINYQGAENAKVFVQPLDGSQGYFIQGAIDGALDLSGKNSIVAQPGFVGAYQVSPSLRITKSFSITLPIVQGALRNNDGSDDVPTEFIQRFESSELVQIKYGFTPKQDPFNLKHDTVFNNGDEFIYARCQTTKGNINSYNGDSTVWTMTFTATAEVPRISPR